jgi:glutathione S-transferase
MYRLIYFSSAGRAEAIRIVLDISKISWENVTVDFSGYSEIRDSGKLPWGLLPALETPSGILSESSAILRYIGNMTYLNPNDEWSAAKIDECLDAISDMTHILTDTFRIDDIHEKIAAREALVAPGGKLSNCYDTFCHKLENSKTGWIAETEGPSIADIKLFSDCFGLVSGNYDGIDVSLLEGRDTLLDFHTRMSEIPEILSRYSDMQDDPIRWIYRPDAFSK